MGIDLVVGIFIDRAVDEDDSLGFYADYTCGLEAINTLLRSLGLPEHHEPVTLAGQKAFHQTVTSSLLSCKDIAWDIEEQTALRFPHLIGLDAGVSLCLPLLFAEVYELPPPFTSDMRRFGSSYKLYEECRLLAKILGIYNLIADDASTSGTEQCSQDPVVLMLEHALDLNQKESKLPILSTRELLFRRYPLLAENPWAVVGTGACQKLYEAALFSIKHKAALVVY